MFIPVASPQFLQYPLAMATVSLSELLGLPVYDSSGTASGRVREVAIAPQEDHCRVALVIVKTSSGNRILPLAAVSEINNSVHASTAAAEWVLADGSEGLLLLSRDLLDQQVIDVHGRKGGARQRCGFLPGHCIRIVRLKSGRRRCGRDGAQYGVC